MRICANFLSFKIVSGPLITVGSDPAKRILIIQGFGSGKKSSDPEKGSGSGKKDPDRAIRVRIRKNGLDLAKSSSDPAKRVIQSASYRIQTCNAASCTTKRLSSIQGIQSGAAQKTEAGCFSCYIAEILITFLTV